MDKNKMIIIVLIAIILALSILLFATINSHAKENTQLAIISNSTLYEGDSIEVKLTDSNGNPIADQTIDVAIVNNLKTVNYEPIVTDANGIAQLKLNESAGNYTVNCSYGGNDKYVGSANSKTITIIEEVIEMPTETTTTSQASSTQDTSAGDNVRQEDQVTSDGWDPKQHEVSREQLDDGNERVTYDDGYTRVVDKDGNILSYGY